MSMFVVIDPKAYLTTMSYGGEGGNPTYAILSFLGQDCYRDGAVSFVFYTNS